MRKYRSSSVYTLGLIFLVLFSSLSVIFFVKLNLLRVAGRRSISFFLIESLISAMGLEKLGDDKMKRGQLGLEGEEGGISKEEEGQK